MLLALFYALALLAPFVAPYPQDELDRSRFYHPPQALHWRDAAGRLHLRPFVYATVPGQAIFEYREDRARELPLRFFVRGAPLPAAGPAARRAAPLRRGPARAA